MEKVFVNFTNHPSSDWGEKQTTEAEKYGKVHDIPFPQVDPMSTEQEIQQLGEQCYKEIMKYHPIAVLCQGEFTLAVYVINRLRQKNIKVLAAWKEIKNKAYSYLRNLENTANSGRKTK